LEPAVAIRRAHDGNLDMLIAQSSDTSGPFAFDRGTPFQLEAEFLKEINGPSEVFDDDAYVVHPLERHVSNLQGVAWSDNARSRCRNIGGHPGPIHCCPHQKHESWTASNPPSRSQAVSQKRERKTGGECTVHRRAGATAAALTLASGRPA